MESAEGMPANQVAWGRLSGGAALRDVLKVHRLHLDLTEKTRPIAQQRDRTCWRRSSATLQNGHKFPGAPNIAEPVRFGMLIGHDTNIVNVAGLLNLGWEIPGYQDNEAPPGSALAFELLREGRRASAMCGWPTTPRRPSRCARRRRSISPSHPAWWRSTCRPAAYDPRRGHARSSASSRSPRPRSTRAA